MKKKIIIFGASGHAKVVIDIIEKQDIYDILGVIDYMLPRGAAFFGYQIIGKDEDFPDIIHSSNVYGCVVAIGDNWQRQKVVHRIQSFNKEIAFVTPIHPTVQLGNNVVIGQGSVIMAGAIINPDTKIGDFSIVNTGAIIDHDCLIGNFSSLAPGTVMGGNSSIGDFSVLSIGATVLHATAIGEQTVVGGGSLVNKNIGSYVVAYGVPSRIVRKRVAGEKYL